MGRPMRWIAERVLPYLAVGTACFALAVVASADPDTSVPGTYANMVRRWHLAAPAQQTMGTRPLLVFEMLNTGDRLALVPRYDDGSFDEEDLVSASHVLPRSAQQ